MAQLPEIERYLAAVERVRVATREAADAAVDANPFPGWDTTYEERIAANRRQNNALEAIYEREEAGKDKALTALKAEATHPVVVWVLELLAQDGNMHYWSEAKTLLSALTVDGDHLAELDETAKERKYCNVYHAFRRRALEAGVLTETNPARAALLRALGVIYVEEANRLLDAFDREVTERVVMGGEDGVGSPVPASE